MVSGIAVRANGRAAHEFRNLSITYDVCKHAAGSLIIEMGNTKVLCSVTLQKGVPQFLRGSGQGWLTAEYAMLPASTASRSARTTTNGRAQEISRLIGRALRSLVDLKKLGERTIYIDCDVMTADGSTRTASVTGACLALRRAMDRWAITQEVPVEFLKHEVVGLSVGLAKDSVLVDIDCAEDNAIDADFTFVVTRAGALVEVQGTAEMQHVAWGSFERACAVAREAAVQLFAQCDLFIPPAIRVDTVVTSRGAQKAEML